MPIPTFLQGAASTNSAQTGSTLTQAFSNPTAAGSLLVAVCQIFNGGNPSTASCSDNQGGNTWHMLPSTAGLINPDALSSWFAYALNTTGGSAATVKFTFGTASSGDASIAIGEYSNVSALRTNGAGTTGTVGSGTLLVPTDSISPTIGDLLIAWTALFGSGIPSIAAGGSYNLREVSHNGTNVRQAAFEDFIAISASSQNATFSFATNTSNILYASQLIAFAPTVVYSISGNAGIAGAIVSWTGTASGSTTADGSGNYTISGLTNGSYTVTASKTGYSFTGPTPANPQVVSGANLTGVNFVATQILVATPTFSPVAGTYGSAQTVTISSTDSGLSGFAITYTTDGTTPVPGSHGTVYTVPITVSTTQTVKAVASATGYANSATGSAAYVISIPPSVYSVPDCRNYATFPNNSVTVQGTKQYTVPAHPSRTPPVDSRVNKPVDSRKSPNIPQNSRTNPPFES